MRRYFRSLWFRLVFGLVVGSVAAVLVACLFLYIRFKNVSAEFRERTLQGQARLISKAFQLSSGHEIALPKSIASYYRNGIGKFAVVGEDDTLLTGSAGVDHSFLPIDDQASREFFSYPEPDGEAAYHGISLRIKGSAPPAWVQVIFKDNEVIFDSVLEEFMQDIAWIWAPFVFVILLINFFVIRIGFRPLIEASAQASTIGPLAVSKRLSEADMPKEVLSFVRAINHALDRLEAGYKAQQAFIADAAHELRTPVAVIATHLDMLPNFDGKSALKDELGGLRRLVSQLLDNARIEAMSIATSDEVDLNDLAADVATYLAPWAVSLGKTVEVARIARPAIVNGAYDYLFRAIRNLVENAIEHTPAGTAAYITVENPVTLVVADCGHGVPKPDREAIFERFWQGGRDRGGGAGLGMTIISRTIAAHRGKIEIGDRKGGGATFRVTFPDFAGHRMISTAAPKSRSNAPANSLRALHAPPISTTS
jgi:signal transduction histidine kinase